MRKNTLVELIRSHGFGDDAKEYFSGFDMEKWRW